MIELGSFVYKVSQDKSHVCIRAIVKSCLAGRWVEVANLSPTTPYFPYYGGFYRINLDDGWFETEEEAWKNHFDDKSKIVVIDLLNSKYKECFKVEYDINDLFNEKEQGTMRVIKSIDNDISVTDMKDGQIGKIVKWIGESCIGRIVQRYKNHLITLGRDSGYSFQDFFNGVSVISTDCRIKILPKGTQLEI